MPNKGGKLYIKVQNWTHFLQGELHPNEQTESCDAFRLNMSAYLEYINLEWLESSKKWRIR